MQEGYYHLNFAFMHLRCGTRENKRPYELELP